MSDLNQCYYLTPVDANDQPREPAKRGQSAKPKIRRLTPELEASVSDLYAQDYPLMDIAFILDISLYHVKNALKHIPNRRIR